MPRVSVIIPSFNHAAFVAEAVNSVLHQSIQDLELIVIDDGSTDDSLSVLNGFHDPRMRVVQQANLGAHAAINHGFQLASGDYLAILNSDDVYHPNRLESVMRVLDANPDLGLAGSFIEVIDSRGTTTSVKHGYKDLEPWLLDNPERSWRATSSLRAALLTENYFATTSNFVLRGKCSEQVGGFSPLQFVHDWDYALRVSEIAAITLVPEALLRYRLHANNTIRQNKAAMIFEICWCLAVHLPNAAGEQLISPSADWTDRLLHSIYTYDCDRVLNLMLIEGLANNRQTAVGLLAPDNPRRAIYMEYIQQRTKTLSHPNPKRLSESNNQINLLIRAGALARWLWRKLFMPKAL